MKKQSNNKESHSKKNWEEEGVCAKKKMRKSREKAAGEDVGGEREVWNSKKLKTRQLKNKYIDSESEKKRPKKKQQQRGCRR